MICLRLWRSLLPGLTGFAPLGPAALPCALLLGLLAVPGPSATAEANRSRARHLTPALQPLHYTEHSVATPHHGKSQAKQSGVFARHGSHGAASTHAAAAGHHASAAGRHGSKHAADTDYEAPVPLLRAGHGKFHGSGELASGKIHARPGALLSAKAKWQPRGSRLPLPAPASVAAHETVVAEVTGHSAHGDTLAHLHGKSGAGQLLPPSARNNSPVIVAVASGATPFTAPTGSHAAPIERHSTSVAPPAYAYGTAQPDDLDRSIASLAPRPQLASPAPAVTVQAPPRNPRPTPATPPTQVVDGFGSELALAPALPSKTPGLTRRRNHPVAAAVLSEDTRSSEPAVLAANLPSTLAERDAITAGAMTPSILSPNLPNIYDADGRLMVPAPLRGSREVLVHQNTMADNDGLERIENDAQLNRLRSTGQLIDLPVNASLHVNDNLPLNRRTARPWTALFTQDIARDFYARFHQPLWVTSAARTVAFQSRLIRVNGNAAGLSGDFASPHLTGQAVDFGKRGMSAAELAWMRSYLLPLIQSGKIDVEEEFQQACFHISVYRRYAGNRRLVSQTMQVASQATSPVYAPVQTPRPAAPRAITPLTNPEMTDTDK